MDAADVVSLVIALVVVSGLGLLLSLRRGVDKLSHTRDPEQQEALLKFARDVDRGKAANQGWFF